MCEILCIFKCVRSAAPCGSCKNKVNWARRLCRNTSCVLQLEDHSNCYCPISFLKSHCSLFSELQNLFCKYVPVSKQSIPPRNQPPLKPNTAFGLFHRFYICIVVLWIHTNIVGRMRMTIQSLLCSVFPSMMITFCDFFFPEWFSF